jgi:hypothetical protein
MTISPHARLPPGDELYPNGIFVFNVTKITEYIQEDADRVALEDLSGKGAP